MSQDIQSGTVNSKIKSGFRHDMKQDLFEFDFELRLFGGIMEQKKPLH